MKLDRHTITVQSWGEALRDDTYGLRNLKVVPDVIYDLGAQVGMFTLLAAAYFPNATIVAIEPQPLNYQSLRGVAASLKNVITSQVALGVGQVYSRCTDPQPGETYGFVTEGRFPLSDMESQPTLHHMDTESVSLVELTAMCPATISRHQTWPPGSGQTSLFKIDIEGEEESFILGDMDDTPLRDAAYVVMELHSIGAAGGRGEAVAKWIRSFEATHIVILKRLKGAGGILHMTRR